MREWNLDELKLEIFNKKKKTDICMLAGKGSERTVRRRPRDEEERAVLDHLCLTKWRKAEESGKIRYISKTEWYYEP